MPGQRIVITIEQATLTREQFLVKHIDRAKTISGLVNVLQGIGAGSQRSGRFEVQVGQGIGGTAASQTVTYASSAGAQTVVIAGRSVAFTAGATDAATVQNAIAAIRADAIASGLVFIPTPTKYNLNNAAVLTLWANTVPMANAFGNAQTLSVTGTGATAGGATFTGGVNATANGFTL